MTFDEILEFLLAGVAGGYDVSVGSFVYDLLYPVAEQIYRLEQKYDMFRDDAFAITASGEWLDKKTAEQGITRRSATYATGIVRIKGRKGEVILAGAKVAAENILFAVNETTIIPDSEYADVTATCTIAGSVGNVNAGVINRFPLTLPGLTEVTNPKPFSGGYDEENDYDLRERYLDKLAHPAASGNVYHYIEWAKDVPGVGDVRVVPLWNGNGTVKVIITDSERKPAGSELAERVSAYIETQRPVGAEVTVVSAEALTINISVSIAASVDPDMLKELISHAQEQYLSSAAISKGYVSYAKIGSLILAIDGVDDYDDLTVNGGEDNIIIPDGAVPVLGEVIIT